MAAPTSGSAATMLPFSTPGTADSILAKAKAKYTEGDRLQAMKLYEDVLNEEPTPEQRRAALFGVTAVHASFGDVELAQMTLREGLRNGLDYEKALEDPSYITIQLRRFAQQVQIAMANRPPTERPYGSGRSRPASTGGQDLDSILGSAGGDTAEVDTSIGGIARRVALVVLVGVLMGTALWFLGLEYLFPKID
ncbi:hypothetical protein VOLCADRAFT_120180 [Volvox carteri f. nagariensis]|uniref:Tetratricopeptide repeat protein n=1 Tax=Volvox carteri f. nagariensis TaxID=3068 RepID=D8THM8_VOLCA|nr:uncharacterized protein VOLCADRAFT_120180 [Volvox carteri f. nagariensis]EFJ53096.1 hypothetical protein VOLCADRAFT_120180 [Volvox carteri f. nagariensis]|eukprot:XP_002946101.1 hypothetical protein VOLCADRAFT_120180 [Volvox carteri f. nagariensis]